MRDEVADHVAIASAVLAEAVDDGDNRARAGLRLLALIVQALRAGAAEPTFLVRHAAYSLTPLRVAVAHRRGDAKVADA
jgi:hypothetical protein